MKIQKLTLTTGIATVLLLVAPNSFAITKSESLALAGEKIAYGPNFMQAAELIDKALQLDPSNLRARVYKAALAPQMSFRGILSRIKPLVNQLTAEDMRQYQTFVASLPTGAYRSFLLDGPEDIKTERDVQDFFQVISIEQRKVRQLFKEMNEKSIVLYANTPNPKVSDTAIIRDCQFQTDLSPEKWVYNCDHFSKSQFPFEYADWEASRFWLAVAQVQTTLPRAYDLTGLVALRKQFKGAKAISDRQAIHAIRNEAQLGRLVDIHALKEILELGTEGIYALKEAAANQNTICPARSGLRAGTQKTPLTDGFCLSEKAQKIIPVAELGLRGPVKIALEVMKHHPQLQDNIYKTSIDLAKFVAAPPNDLKHILPDKFDACGNSTNLQDPSLGGLFPEGDGINLIRTTFPDFAKKKCSPNTSRTF